MNTGPEREYFRGFIALSLPSECKENISKLQTRLQAHWKGDWIRWTKPSQIHLTLKFLGNIHRSEITALADHVNQAVSAISSFRLSVSGLGCFPSPARPRVLWAGLQGDTVALSRLQGHVRELTKPLSPEKEDRDFHPHLTLARIARWDQSARHFPSIIEKHNDPSLGEWKVETVELYESVLSPQGPTYTRLHSALLAER